MAATAPRAERRLAAILAADIVGYSRLVEQDEAGTLDAIRELRREVINPLLVEHNGRITKLMGDGAIAEFGSVVDAVACAVAVQKAVAASQAAVALDRCIVFRIGINLGDVAVDGDDILGDGVNVAARLEQLCESGGVLVSGTAYDQLQGRLDMPLDFIGEQHVKSIARPVRAYRARFDGRAPAARRLTLPRRIGGVVIASALAGLAVLGALVVMYWQVRPPQRTGAEAELALAVLPFQNMSGDRAATYLGQGVAEDIITVLSTYPGLKVISRSSSFAVDQPAPIQEIGDKLGARYVVEGSGRMLGNQVRITAQLVDAGTGEHFWAERYDQTSTDVLTLQQQVANRIYDTVAGITGEVRHEEERRAWSRSPLDLREYDYYLRGHALFMNDEDTDDPQARAIWEEGLAKFPDSALLRIKLGFAVNRGLMWGLSSDPQADIARVERLADEARAKPQKSKLATWLGHWLDAYVAYWQENWPQVIAAAEATVRLVPNDAFARADLSFLIATAGRTADGIAWAEEALRRDPTGPWLYKWNLGCALYLHGRAADAVKALETVTQFEPIMRAAAYARLGQIEEAKRSTSRLLAAQPAWTIAKEAAFPMLESLERPYLDDLRMAGLPEG